MTKLETLRENRAKAEKALRSMLDEHEAALETRSLSEDEENAAAGAEKRLAQFDAAIERAEAEEARNAAIAEERARQLGTGSTGAGADTSVRVGHEPLTYGPAQDGYSFYRDLLSSAANGPGARAANERLIRHQGEVEKLAAGPQDSAEARNARKAVNEIRRQSPESRASNTGNSSLGDWAPPVFALDDTAHYRDYGRSYIDQLHSMPLPESGMVINIPRVTTPTLAVNQTGGNSANENTSVATRDMTGTYGTGSVQTIVSNDLVSQQYLDRFGPASFAADQLILQDQSTQVNKLLNQFALDQTFALVNANNSYIVYNDSSFGVAKFKQSVHAAKAALRKLQGTVTVPTHLFADADLWETIEGSVDSNGRPLVVPQGVAYNPIAVGDNSGTPEGYTGFRFAALPAFVDQNIYTQWTGNNDATPAYVNDHVALVADLNIGAEWLEGAPVIRVLPQPYANTLTVLIQQFVYCAFVPRYPNAFQVVVGSGTASANLTA